MARRHGIESGTYGKLLLDSGALYKNFTDFDNLGILIGATRGGAVFTRTPEYKDLKYEGIPGQVAGQKQLVGEKVTLDVSIISFDTDNLRLAIPNAIISNFGSDHRQLTGAEWDDLGVHTLTNIALVAQLSGHDEPVALVIDNPLCENDLTFGLKDKAEVVSKWVFSAFYTEAGGFAVPPWRMLWPIEVHPVVAAGIANIAAYSNDGINWLSSASLGSAGTNRALAYGDSRYVMVRQSSTQVRRSTDGINWTLGAVPSSRVWDNAAYGKGHLVVFANSTDKMMYSDDGGVNWTEITLPLSAIGWPDVVYGNGRFVAAYSDAAQGCAYSTDGAAWTLGGLTQVIVACLGYGGGVFVALATGGTNAAYSTDGGLTWTATPIPLTSGIFFGVAYGSGRFVSVKSSSNESMYSTDGINWSAGGNLPSSEPWRDVIYAKGLFIVISGDTTNRKTAYSNDGGLTWNAGGDLPGSGSDSFQRLAY